MKKICKLLSTTSLLLIPLLANANPDDGTSCSVAYEAPQAIEVDMSTTQSCIDSVEKVLLEKDVDPQTILENDGITIMEKIEQICINKRESARFLFNVNDQFFYTVPKKKAEESSTARKTTQTLDLQGNFMSSTNETNSFSNTWDGKYNITTTKSSTEKGNLSLMLEGRIQYIDTDIAKEIKGDWINELKGEVGHTKNKLHIFGNMKIDRDDTNNIDFRTNALIGSGLALLGKNYESDDVFKLSVGVGPEAKHSSETPGLIYDAVVSEVAKAKYQIKDVKITTEITYMHSYKGLTYNNTIKLTSSISAPLAKGISGTLSYDLNYNRDNDILTKLFKVGIHCDIDQIKMPPIGKIKLNNAKKLNN